MKLDDEEKIEFALQIFISHHKIFCANAFNSLVNINQVDYDSANNFHAKID